MNKPQNLDADGGGGPSMTEKGAEQNRPDCGQKYLHEFKSRNMNVIGLEKKAGA